MFTLPGKLHDRTSEAGLWAGLLALAAITLLTSAATMSRYFLGAPIGWVPDWVGYLLAFSIFATVPAVTRRSMHVSMDFLPALIRSAGLRRALTLAAGALTCAVLVWMSLIVWKSLASAYRSGTGTAAGYPIPRWWLLAVVFYGFASSALHVLRAVLASLPLSFARRARPAACE
ncbi:MAG: TRAP transporter small permease [Rhodobacter sp.]|nr:TRAP transporter small permease [Paracoccaceae bacterium]MCC0078124.1 TRAP transporter small permease [Rhodobacter sp.]